MSQARPAVGPPLDESVEGRVLFLNRRSQLQALDGNHKEADIALHAALRLVNELPESTYQQSLLATTLHNLGSSALRQGAAPRAVEYFEASHRLEMQIGKPSAVTMMNLSAALCRVHEFDRAASVAALANEHAADAPPSTRAAAMLHRANAEYARLISDHSAQPWVKSERAKAALRAFVAAASEADELPASDPIRGSVHSLFREARPSIARLVAGCPAELYATTYASPKTTVPVLPRLGLKRSQSQPANAQVASPYKRSNEKIVVETARKVKSEQSAASTLKAHPPAGSRTHRPRGHRDADVADHAPALVMVCPHFLGLQTLFQAANRRKVPAIKSLYLCLRDTEPLLPRIKFNHPLMERFTTDAKLRRLNTSGSVASKVLTAQQIIAFKLLRDQWIQDVGRRYLRQWQKVLRARRSMKPLRRAAEHFLRMTERGIRQLRFDAWRAWRAGRVRSRDDATRAASPRVAAPNSHIERCVMGWISKINAQWKEVDQVRNEGSAEFPEMDVKLRKNKLDFANALSTCYQSYPGEPITDLPGFAAGLEPFVSFLLSDVDSDENVTLLQSILHNIPQLDFNGMISSGKFFSTCADDGALKFLGALAAYERVKTPEDWIDFVTLSLYHDSKAPELIAFVLSQPELFPVGKVKDQLRDYWIHVLEAAGKRGDVNTIVSILNRSNDTGIAVNSQVRDDATVFGLACREWTEAVVKRLLQFPETQYDGELPDGSTPLIQAVLSNRPAVVEMLLDTRAVRVQYKWNGATAKSIAKQLEQDPKIIELLEAQEAAVVGQFRKSFSTHQDDEGEAPSATQRQEPGASVSARPEGAKSPSEFDDMFSVDDEGGKSVNTKPTPSASALEEDLEIAKERHRALLERFSVMKEDAAAKGALVEVSLVDLPHLCLALHDGAVVLMLRDDDAIDVTLLTLVEVGDSGYVLFASESRDTIVVVDVVAKTLSVVGRDLGEDSAAALWEVVTMDNGNTVFLSKALPNHLLQPINEEAGSALVVVPDEDATILSEFVVQDATGVRQQAEFRRMLKQGAQRQEQRRENQRKKRLQIVADAMKGAQPGIDAVHIAVAEDPAQYVWLYDPVRSIPVYVDDPRSAEGAPEFVVHVNDEGYVKFVPRSEPSMALTCTVQEISVTAQDEPDGDDHWFEMLHLSSGNVAFEPRSRLKHVVEARLDDLMKVMGVVPEDDASTWCEFVISKAPQTTVLDDDHGSPAGGPAHATGEASQEPENHETTGNATAAVDSDSAPAGQFDTTSAEAASTGEQLTEVRDPASTQATSGQVEYNVESSAVEAPQTREAPPPQPIGPDSTRSPQPAAPIESTESDYTAPVDAAQQSVGPSTVVPGLAREDAAIRIQALQRGRAAREQFALRVRQRDAALETLSAEESASA